MSHKLPTSRRRLAALAPIAVLLAGCGGSIGFAPQAAPPASVAAQEVRHVIVAFARAMATGHAQQACSLLDAGGQQSVAAELAETSGDATTSIRSLCDEAIALTAQGLSAHDRTVLNTLRVGQVTITADTATVATTQLTSPNGTIGAGNDPAAGDTMTLIKTGHRWLIDTLD